jgi:hypothetical protein
LLAAALNGQVVQANASFEFRNRMGNESLYIWLRNPQTGLWLNNKQAAVLRPGQSIRWNVVAGHYWIALRTQGKATLVLDRWLGPGRVDRLQIGSPAPMGERLPGERIRPSSQPVFHEVSDDYGNATHMQEEWMKPARPPMPGQAPQAPSLLEVPERRMPVQLEPRPSYNPTGSYPP